MFKAINHISDIQPVVADKREIRFLSQPGGLTIACYTFMDSKTFDSPEAVECRGIAFDASGAVVSRPLHKFFNAGEKEWLTPEKLAQRRDLVFVFDKLDGSMIATAFVEGELRWRSKKAFDSDVVQLTQALLADPVQAGITRFAEAVASRGMTAIFELTHPEARIVVAQEKPMLRLLHVRDNRTGAYVMLEAGHPVHALIELHQVPMVERFSGMSFGDVLASLAAMKDREGYVLQYADGEMVKIKCPWYLRLHRCLMLLRERDIAVLALTGELDDVKGALSEAGVDLAPVNAIEARVKAILVALMDEVDRIYEETRHLERKDFAIRNKENALFGLLMQRYIGKDVPLVDWYMRTRLKDDFSLRELGSPALIDALDG